MRILAVHGIGHCDADPAWRAGWTAALAQGLGAWNPGLAPEVDFLVYDELFEQQPLDAPVVAVALARLVRSGLFHGLQDLVGRRRGGVGEALDGVRWTVGMVAQWVALERLRTQLRERLTSKIKAFAPDVILAHSLGSLVAYDTLRTGAEALSANRTLVTFGSQLGNPAVRSTFGGRVAPIEPLKFWWHLFNTQDDAFTTPLTLPDPERFRQVETFFDINGLLDHDGAHYLGHRAAVETVWQDLASLAPTRAPKRALRKPGAGASVSVPPPKAMALSTLHTRAARKAATRRPRRRALLVGVAEYPDPANTLDGPVNDVFGVSAVLQELGFEADDIRTVVNDRATAQGIRERLQWLLADPMPGDQLVFYFAGHGAQIPGYGRDSELDHVDECLVPYDFDWAGGRAITDDEFAALYGQLPYDTRFTAVLDCCHSGGMVRSGNVRARGITPPDDIRHRLIRWDKTTEMWVPRERLAGGTRPDAVRIGRDQEQWLGSSGAVRRLGRGTSLWLPTHRQYRKAVAQNGHQGPFAPILLEACREGELAYEYKHGVVAHGAFTFALCTAIRAALKDRKRKAPVTFADLIRDVQHRVGLVVPEPQNPQLNCATFLLDQPFPGLG